MTTLQNKQNSILLNKSCSLNAEQKYFLIRLVHCYEVGETIDKLEVELAEQLGMSKPVLVTAKRQLIDLGFLEDTPVKIRERGRPRHGIKMRATVAMMWSEDIAADTFCTKNEIFTHQELINEVLFYPNKDRAKEEEKKARNDGVVSLVSEEADLPKQSAINRPSSKILLAILLAHADARGVVSTLGTSDFKELIKMSRDRLVSQMNSLSKNGVLLAKIPGVTSKKLLGQAKGIYILHLGWQGFQAKKQPTLVTFYIADTLAYSQTESANIYSQAKSLLNPPAYQLPEDNIFVRGDTKALGYCSVPIGSFKSYQGFIPYFARYSSDHIQGYLQWQLDSHALRCIATGRLARGILEFPEEIPASEKVVAAQAFLPKESIDLARSRKEAMTDEKREADRDTQVVYFLDAISQNIALDIIAKWRKSQRLRRVRGLGRLQLKDMYNLLMPKQLDKDLRSFCMISYEKSSKPVDTKFMVISEVGETKPLQFEVFSTPEELPSGVLQKYGLENAFGD